MTNIPQAEPCKLEDVTMWACQNMSFDEDQMFVCNNWNSMEEENCVNQNCKKARGEGDYALDKSGRRIGRFTLMFVVGRMPLVQWSGEEEPLPAHQGGVTRTGR